VVANRQPVAVRLGMNVDELAVVELDLLDRMLPRLSVEVAVQLERAGERLPQCLAGPAFDHAAVGQSLKDDVVAAEDEPLLGRGGQRVA